MTPDPIISRRLFVDGITRPVFLDDRIHQYFINTDGHTRCYGTWLFDDADVPVVIPAQEQPA